jgi:hypothetical protein
VRVRRKRRGAPTSDDERAVGPDLVLGLALAIARLHAEKSLECAAAYRESDEEASSAWQADLEFGNALHLAYQLGETKSLRDFVKAGKSVPQAHVLVAGKSIPMRVLVADLLGDHHQPEEQRSRPHRVASEAPAAAQAERNAAWLLAFAQKGWLRRNGRKRVPGVVTNEMIKVAIEEAAKTFRVPVSAIYESNIRNLLKNRQVVVRN